MKASSGAAPSTGLPAFDAVLGGIWPGDNIVWEVADVDDYITLVTPFVEAALAAGHKLLYFRFARHKPVMEPHPDVEVIRLDPQMGFEAFLDHIHGAVERAGVGSYHVFDSLSDLTADWYCDQMLGNFFQLTCPFLYRLDTIAYFALMRGFHSFYAINPISQTTQLLLEVYRRDKKLYVQPLKVDGREKPQVFMLHQLDNGHVELVTESHTVSEILTSSHRSALGLSQYHLGVWTRTFVQAEVLLEQSRRGEAPPEAVETMFHRILRMAISRDERVLALAERYFDLSDMVNIGRRLLGTGLIGGKSVGMLLARAILKKADPKWESLLEVHDSFYIPSDVFYTFLVRNGCWHIRKRQIQAADYLEGLDEARHRILMGTFPEHIEKRFSDMLDYFGESPIIVRSSSLLEDNFGNSFAGKYDSVFCANQGSHEERLKAFMAAVKMVYASTMSHPALSYRARFGLLDRDEQMALLVQRVSGGQHGDLYFPQVAGAGFSFNPYVWNESIEPEAGVIRLVFGLGTRAVDRSDDDYTRVVALNEPDLRPETESGAVLRYSQRKVDVLDLATNQLCTKNFEDVAPICQSIPMSFYLLRDPEWDRRAREHGRTIKMTPTLGFDELFARTAFIQDMREMLRIIHDAYEYPVDIEFTASFDQEGNYKVNLVQCRPFQVKDVPVIDDAPDDVSDKDLVLETHGPVIGRSRIDAVDRVIYVVPATYGQLPVNDRYAIARTIGRLTRLNNAEDPKTLMLLGPGRWGTTTPSLGVPVSFAEISSVAILCEIVAMREDLVPDVSLGTHFFSELVEMDMLYMALFPEKTGNFLNAEFFEGSRNRLADLVPSAAHQSDIIRVIDMADFHSGDVFRIYADVLKQRVLCYIDRTRVVS